MARTHGRIYVAIWADRDFRSLTKDSQRLYLLLITQPQITNCGVLPYVPKKWLRLAPDETEHSVTLALLALIERRFIVVDEQTDELLIRTYVRHDGILKFPQLKGAAKREYGEIESRTIRQTLLGEYPDLFQEVANPDDIDPSPDPLFDPSTDPLPHASRDSSTNASTDSSRSRVRARAPAPTPTPTPNPLVTEDPELYVARETNFDTEPTDDAPEPEANSTGFSINPDTVRTLP